MFQKAQSKKTQQDLLDELHPVFRHKVELILAELQKKGWKPTIIFAERTREQQQDAIRRGASHTMKSWHVRSTIGLMPAGRAAIQVILGNAVDIVDSRYGWEGKAAKLDFAFWKDLGATAKSLGCQWGGAWKKPDVAHVQMYFTDQIAQDSMVV